MYDVSKLIKVAMDEVNYCEKSRAAYLKDKSCLDDKARGAGTDNYTKYGRDMNKICPSIYRNGEYWCDTFTYYCFVKAFGKDGALKLLYGWSAYTPSSANLFKKHGRWHTGADVQVGDKIFFKNSQRICHTGIVISVDKKNKKIMTVEGNSTANHNVVVANGGCVCMKVYDMGNSRIAGYGRPDYAQGEVVRPVNTEDTSKIGWHTDNIGKWYRYKEGTGTDTYYHNTVREINGRCYAFNKNGYVIVKTLSKIGFDTDGALIVK